MLLIITAAGVAPVASTSAVRSVRERREGLVFHRVLSHFLVFWTLVAHTVIIIANCKLPLPIKCFLVEKTSAAIVIFDMEISQLEWTVLVFIHGPISVAFWTHLTVIPSFVVLYALDFVWLCYMFGQLKFIKVFPTLVSVTTFPVQLISVALVSQINRYLSTRENIGGKILNLVQFK